MKNHTKESNQNSNYFHNPILMLAFEYLCNEINPPMQLVHDTLGVI